MYLAILPFFKKKKETHKSVIKKKTNPEQTYNYHPKFNIFIYEFLHK